MIILAVYLVYIMVRVLKIEDFLINSSVHNILLLFISVNVLFYIQEKNSKMEIIKNCKKIEEQKSWKRIVESLPMCFLTFDIGSKQFLFSNNHAQKMLMKVE